MQPSSAQQKTGIKYHNQQKYQKCFICRQWFQADIKIRLSDGRVVDWLHEDNRCVECCQRFCWLCEDFHCHVRSEPFNATRKAGLEDERRRARDAGKAVFETIGLPGVLLKVRDA